jgi:hypothetical protein
VSLTIVLLPTSALSLRVFGEDVTPQKAQSRKTQPESTEATEALVIEGDGDASVAADGEDDGTEGKI